MVRTKCRVSPYTYRAAAQPKLEYEVKAAFLLNFTKFVAWPDGAFAGAASPFTICVLGNDPFGRTLDETASGETVGSRKLVVRRIDEAPAAQACQIVFFGSEGKKPPVSPGSLGSGVLTVGEGQSFMRDGGMIAFVIDNRRVRFDINQSAAETRGAKAQLQTVERREIGGTMNRASGDA